ncbi:MAG TPA: molecular chaperone HtpG, partial [Crocinitomicaceae bacterium]|nr:molecular chaperone HtpG [Crocinitomicaceae bacterium]
DSPDIPLNVSRLYLQSDGNVKKISTHITKKVADKLAEMFKKDRVDFEAKWADLKVFVEYGTLMDEKFAEKAKTFTLLKSLDGKFYTVEEYLEKVKPLQTDKDNKLVLLYTSDEEGQYRYVKVAKDRGYDVLVIDGPLAPHWISKFEQDNQNVTLTRVDADSIDNLIKKDEEIPSKLTKEDEENVKVVFEEVVDKEKFNIELKSMSPTDAPIIITQPEFIRRMMEQQKLGGNAFFGAFPETYKVMVNANHPKIEAITKESDNSAKTEKAKQLTDLALLSQGLLKGEALDKFIERSINLV